MIKEATKHYKNINVTKKLCQPYNGNMTSFKISSFHRKFSVNIKNPAEKKRSAKPVVHNFCLDKKISGIDRKFSVKD